MRGPSKPSIAPNGRAKNAASPAALRSEAQPTSARTYSLHSSLRQSPATPDAVSTADGGTGAEDVAGAEEDVGGVVSVAGEVPPAVVGFVVAVDSTSASLSRWSE